MQAATDELDIDCMGLFSFLRKNKQESSPDNGEFYSRAEGESQPTRTRGRRSKTADVADPVLPEKKRARRRLIGALALVLAAVIGLPMFLDSEPQPIAEDIAIQIPAKDKVAPLTFRAPAVVASAPAENKEPVEAPAEAPKVAAPAPSPATASSEKDAAKTAAPAAESKPAPLTEKPATPAKPADASKEKAHDDSARATALLEGKSAETLAPAKSTPAPAGDKYIIQVAALASKAKINELQGKLKHAGIASYTQTVATQSGERTRVRIGPFSSKAEAEKMLPRLKKIGLGGTVIPGAH